MGAWRFRSGRGAGRGRAGLGQAARAARVGVSRQTLGALEAGATVPPTSPALALARALGCRVEDLFWLTDEDGPLAAAFPVGASGRVGQRVALGAIDGRWIAHPLDRPGDGATPADGLLTA